MKLIATDLIIAGTGHRPQKLGGFTRAVEDRLFNLAMHHLGNLAPTTVITGMALGWDTAIAEAAYCLDIPYRAYIPFVGQESRWSAPAQKLYHNILKYAAEVVEVEEPGYAAWKMLSRDRRMVDDSHKMLALWDGSESSGTGKTVEYALSRNKEVINLWSEYA